MDLTNTLAKSFSLSSTELHVSTLDPTPPRWRTDSLVDPGVVLPLPGEAEHATDDAAVLQVPVGVADLLPLAAVLHLHVALRHGDALAVRREDGPDPHVLHLDVEVLGRGRGKHHTRYKTSSRVAADDASTPRSSAVTLPL